MEGNIRNRFAPAGTLAALKIERPEFPVVFGGEEGIGIQEMSFSVL